MLRRIRSAGHRATWTVTWVGCFAAATVQGAPPPGERLLPASTSFFITCRNTRELEAAGRKTVLGRLREDKLFEPFIDDLESQIERRMAEENVRIGIKLVDLKGLCDGQITLAVIPLSADAEGKPRTGTIVLVDVTGHVPQAENGRKKIAAAMAKNQAQTTALQTPSGASGMHYVVPSQKEGGRAVTFVEALQTVGGDTVWLLSDHEQPVHDVSAAIAAGERAEPLAAAESFRKLMSDTAPPADEPPSQLAAFVDPLALVEALRAYEHPPQKHKPDALAVLRSVGFDALKGFGAQATFAVGKHGLRLRASGLAPAPWQKSMNMLRFTTGNDFAPQAWVADDMVGYASVYWNVLEAYDHFGPLFDGFLEDEGIWNDVVRSMREDPDGVKFDLRADFFAMLGRRVTAVVDRRLPSEADSSRYLLAIEIARAEEVDRMATMLEKAFANEPSVQRTKLGDLNVYQIEATEEVPAGAPDQTGVENGKRKIVGALVTVAEGNVFFASHLDMLQKVLRKPAAPSLANDPQYVAVTAELAPFIPQKNAELAGLGFMRLDELLRIDYELFRGGKMSGSQTLLGRLLSLALRDPTSHRPLPIAVDGSKLPPFEAVRKYLPPMGTVVRVVPDGWRMTTVWPGSALPPPQPKPAAEKTQPAEAPAAAK